MNAITRSAHRHWWQRYAPPARGIVLCLMVAALAAPAAAQRDAKVLQRNLPELVQDAHTIVVGRITRLQAEPHPQIPQLMTVVVDLSVSEVWKGTAGKRFSFRAFVNHELDYKEKLGYSRGEEVLLMLTRPSQYGLSSPAGMEQGRFRVRVDATGRKTAVNGYNNAGLFFRARQTAPKLDADLAGLPARQLLVRHSSGPILLDDLRLIVQKLTSSSER